MPLPPKKVVHLRRLVLGADYMDRFAGLARFTGLARLLNNPILISQYDYMEAGLARFAEISLVASGLARFAGMKFPM